MILPQFEFGGVFTLCFAFPHQITPPQPWNMVKTTRLIHPKIELDEYLLISILRYHTLRFLDVFQTPQKQAARSLTGLLRLSDAHFPSLGCLFRPFTRQKPLKIMSNTKKTPWICIFEWVRMMFCSFDGRKHDSGAVLGAVFSATLRGRRKWTNHENWTKLDFFRLNMTHSIHSNHQRWKKNTFLWGGLALG